VPLIAKLKNTSRPRQAAIAFYALSGIILLAFLPLSGFPPHLGFLGILSLITAYSLFTIKSWTPWLVFVLLVANSGFALFTLASIGFSNILVALSMIVFAALTWAATVLVLFKKKI
jgi:hypothetical protein